MKLRDLLRDVPVRATHGDLDVEVTAVTSDSRMVTRGALFVAIPGLQQDGAKFVSQAVEKGAVPVVGLPLQAGPTIVEVDDARVALALIAANFYGRPAEK